VAITTKPDMNEILQVPGYLYWEPSALDVEANWGTLLGFTKTGVSFEPGYGVQHLTAMETGIEPTIKVYLGSAPRISVILRNWNATMISVLFPGLKKSGATAINAPGAIVAGQDLTAATYAKYLLFVPVDQTNNPCFLLQSAAPNILRTAKLQASHKNRMLFPCVFDAIRKSSDVDGLYYIGPLSGGTLR
jgi:hypothetical protein